jgi:hypothetical protein
MRRLFTALVLTLSLGACATFEPVPKDYTGPTATVVDTGTSEDGTKARLYALVAIDGNGIRNAFSASAEASAGRGATIVTVYPTRKVPVRPMKLKLRASHATGAPIHAIASQMAGTWFAVEGIVDFTPEAGRTYVVKGELGKEKSSVWIEDKETGKPVTSVLSQ